MSHLLIYLLTYLLTYFPTYLLACLLTYLHTHLIDRQSLQPSGTEPRSSLINSSVNFVIYCRPKSFGVVRVREVNDRLGAVSGGA